VAVRAAGASRNLTTAVIARLDRATQYAVTPVVLQTPLEYWITRLRGW
jgi:hypothetical protein